MSEETNQSVSVDDDGTIKVDLRKDAVQEQSTDEVPVQDEPTVSEGVPEQDVEEAAPEPTREEDTVQTEEPVEEEQPPVLQEITDEEVEEATEQLNDEIQDAQELAEFCKHIPCKINIIEYNPIDDAEFQQASTKKVDAFAAFLENRNLIVNIRRSRGKDIDAACGQLANKNGAIAV